MADKMDLADVTFWKEKLGLLPIPLFISEKPNRYVLLNGSRGNFCLDIGQTKIFDTDGRSLAWSSNVGHYVTVKQNTVEVQRWDRANSSPLIYERDKVFSQLETFHSFLEKNSPQSEISIVNHAIQVFRRLRATLGDNFDGRSSLGAFLYLIACAADNVDRKSTLINDWKLSDKAIETAYSLSESNWEVAISELSKFRKMEELQPNITLLLRHASGKLFQEAHYEAIFVAQNQLSMDGFLRSAIKIQKTNAIAGLQFTPSWLVRPVVEESLAAFGPLQDSTVIFDPACGSGEFLRECLRHLILNGYTGKIKLIGWDISEIACDMARFILAWEGRDNVIRDRLEVDIRCIDSLNPESHWPNNADLIVMNPPFVAWQDLDIQQKDNLISILGSSLGQRSDLSHGFIFKASLCLKGEGVLGTVLPASLLDGQSSFKLRRELSGLMSPRLIARLGSQMLFPGALVDAALYVAKKTQNDHSLTTAFWADYRSSSNSSGLRALRRSRYLGEFSSFPINGDGYSIYKSDNLGKTAETWAPRPYKFLKQLEALGNLPKVSDLFNVRQGTLTGLNEVFLISKQEWESFSKKEKGYFRPAVINKSIDHGYLKDICYCFYPYADHEIITEDELEDEVSAYFNSHLLPNKTKLLARARAKSGRWWGLSEHRNWQMTRDPKLVSTYFGSKGSFAWDRTGDYVIVQGYAWLPKPKSVFTEEANLAYLVILNSTMFFDLLSAISNNLGGGQLNLSARFVNEVALPDIMSPEIDGQAIRRLVEIGRRIHAGNLNTNESTITELVSSVYHLPLDS